MNPITTDLNVINPYAQNPAAIAASQSTTAVQPTTATTSAGSAQDSSQFSQQALQALIAATQGSSNVASKDPLANLVSNGTITQDQSDAINSAFQAARQANTSGTYGSSQINPISSLVANGTITQTQATAIQGDLKSAGGHRHHGGKKVDSATQIDLTALTSATDTTDTTSAADAFSTILANLESSSTGAQDQNATENALESLIQNNGSATA
jgi:competence protein ComGC